MRVSIALVRKDLANGAPLPKQYMLQRIRDYLRDEETEHVPWRS